MVKDATAHLPPGRASVANGWPVSGTRPGGGTTIGRPALTRVEQFTAGFAVRVGRARAPADPGQQQYGHQHGGPAAQAGRHKHASHCD